MPTGRPVHKANPLGSQPTYGFNQFCYHPPTPLPFLPVRAPPAFPRTGEGSGHGAALEGLR